MQACNAEGYLVGDQRESMFRYPTTQRCMHSYTQTILSRLMQQRTEHLPLARFGVMRWCRFVERLMCGRLPDGWRIADSAGRMSAVPPQGANVSEVPPYCTAATRRPPLDGTLAVQEMEAVRARLSVDMQLHQHTARCKKGGHAGTDDDCALDGVRPRHASTSYESGVLLARLDVPNMVFHSPTVSMGLGCNNAVYLFAEQSKYNLRLHRHRAAVARGEQTASDAPVPRSIAEVSAEASEYASKYTGKHDFQPRSANAIALCVERAQVR